MIKFDEIDRLIVMVVAIMGFCVGGIVALATERDSELETKAKAVIQVCEEHLPRDQHCELKAEPIRGKEQ